MIREWIQANKPSIIVGILGASISMVLALALTGDFNEAVARANRR